MLRDDITLRDYHEDAYISMMQTEMRVVAVSTMIGLSLAVLAIIIGFSKAIMVALAANIIFMVLRPHNERAALASESALEPNDR